MRAYRCNSEGPLQNQRSQLFMRFNMGNQREAKEPPASPEKTGLEAWQLAGATCLGYTPQVRTLAPQVRLLSNPRRFLFSRRLFSFGFLGLCVPRRKPGAHSKKAAPPPPFPFTHTHPRREAQQPAMHTPQHTPGPWHLGSAFDPSGTKLAVWPEPSEALNPICAIAAQDELAPIDWHNARLIAAAPDLLAAVVSGLASYDEANEHRMRFAEYQDPPNIAFARAAVQKATTPLTD